MSPLPARLGLVLALTLSLVAIPASASAGCPGGGSVDQARRAIACQINKQRGKRDKRKLRQRDSLEAAAQFHANDMAINGYFSHNSPDGSSSFDRAVAFGYLGSGGSGGVGEVIAEGVMGWSTAATVEEWMSSGQHRSVLLSRRFRHIGVGVTTLNGKLVYAVDFGHR